MTKIEWTDEVWNPVRGCSRVSEGCRNCYAERMAARFETATFKPSKRRPLGAGPFSGFTKGGKWTGRVELIPEKLDEPLHWRKPRLVFVNSMSDLFHEGWLGWERPGIFRGPGFGQLVDVAHVMRQCERHTFQILTKRAHVMADMWPRVLLRLNAQALPNVWLGVSCEDQKRADERVPLLLQTPAAKRFVSLEPLLGPVDLDGGIYDGPGWLRGWHTEPEHARGCDGSCSAGRCPEPVQTQNDRLDWVIVGGESGPGARPCDVAWVRLIVRQCREEGVPCFVKQLGARPKDNRVTGPGGFPSYEFKTKNPKGGDPSEWPEDLRVREFPA